MTLLKLKTWVLDRVGYQIRSKIYDNYSYHSFKMFFFFWWFLSVSVCGRIIYIFTITDTLSMIWIMTWRIYAAGKCMIMPLIDRSIDRVWELWDEVSWNFIPFLSRFSAFFSFYYTGLWSDNICCEYRIKIYFVLNNMFRP